MRESDIKWEDEKSSLWVGKTKFGFTLFRNESTHSKGFLTFGKLADAIENGIALAASPSTVEKLIW